MKLKIEIKTIGGSVLFSLERENNTIKKTLVQAVKEGAYLEGAKNIPQSYINMCSRDMLFVFEHLKSELPYLREKLLSGNVDGTQYEGTCACLIGSLANSKKQNSDELCESILKK